MDSVGVRYIVDDVAAAVSFYTDRLGFTVEMDFSPGFAAVRRGGLQLLLNKVGGVGGASQPMPDGRSPEPGGWNRFQLVVEDLAAEVARLRGEGATFRNEIVVGVGGSQILLEDPSGNVIELFQPAGESA
jgi:catechol 2,3-dioxygenase-like lactoylglutathione lyase family enzyme